MLMILEVGAQDAFSLLRTAYHVPMYVASLKWPVLYVVTAHACMLKSLSLLPKEHMPCMSIGT